LTNEDDGEIEQFEFDAMKKKKRGQSAAYLKKLRRENGLGEYSRKNGSGSRAYGRERSVRKRSESSVGSKLGL